MRIRSLMLLAALLLVAALLVGCGDRSTPSEDTAEAPETTVADTDHPATEAADSPEETPPADDGPSEATDADRDVPAEDDESQPSDGKVIAYVNGRPAYQDKLDAAEATLMNQYAQMYAQFGMSLDTLLAGAEGRLFELEMKAEALRRVAAAILVEEEAEHRGIEPSEEDVQAEFEGQYAVFLAGQGWTEEEFIAYLEEQGTTFESFKETGRDSVRWQLTLDAVRRTISDPVEITEEDLAAYFEEHRADYQTEEQVKASHILLGTSDEDLIAYLAEHEDEYGSGEEAPQLEDVREELVADIQEQAEEIRDDLTEGGADFAAMAREHSTGPSGPSGGDLGWFARGRMVPAFEEAAFALEVGQISDIVETQYGFHIIKLTDHREATNPQLGEIADQVRADLEEQIRNERMQLWFDEVYEEATFDIRLPLVNAMWTRQQDVDRGIEAFEELRQQGTVDEPYLPYILGTTYESKLYDAQAELEELQAAEESTPEQAERIEGLQAQIDDLLDQALAEFRLALERVGDEQAIQQKIDELERLQGTDGEAAEDASPAEVDGSPPSND